MDGGAPLPPRPRRPWLHNWHSYEVFQVVLLNQIQRLRNEGLILRDTLSFFETIDLAGELVAVVLRGRIFCAGDVIARIEQRMQVRRGIGNRYEVKPVHHQYHAWVRARADRPRRDLIRYDTNQHRHELHAHLFTASGIEMEVRTVPADEMPELEDFVRYIAKAG